MLTAGKDKTMQIYTCQFRRDYPAKKPVGTIKADAAGVTFSWPEKQDVHQKECSRTISYDQIEKVTCREITKQHEIGDRLAGYLLWLVGTAAAYAFVGTDLIMHILNHPIVSLGWDIIFLISAAAYLLPQTVRARRRIRRWHGCVLQIEVQSSDSMTAVGFDEDIEAVRLAGQVIQQNLSEYQNHSCKTGSAQ